MVGNMSQKGEEVGSDTFLSGTHTWFLEEGDEVFITCDLDTDNHTQYRYYRQRLTLFYVDEHSRYGQQGERYTYSIPIVPPADKPPIPPYQPTGFLI
jgi:hypothetical protein